MLHGLRLSPYQPHIGGHVIERAFFEKLFKKSEKNKKKWRQIALPPLLRQFDALLPAAFFVFQVPNLAFILSDIFFNLSNARIVIDATIGNVDGNRT